MNRRLNNEAIKMENRRRAKANKKRRIAEDPSCKEQNRERARVNTRQRLQENEQYKEINIARSRIRYQILSAQPKFKIYQKAAAQARRFNKSQSGKNTFLQVN